MVIIVAISERRKSSIGPRVWCDVQTLVRGFEEVERRPQYASPRIRYRVAAHRRSGRGVSNPKSAATALGAAVLALAPRTCARLASREVPG